MIIIEVVYTYKGKNRTKEIKVPNESIIREVSLTNSSDHFEFIQVKQADGTWKDMHK